MATVHCKMVASSASSTDDLEEGNDQHIVLKEDTIDLL